MGRNHSARLKGGKILRSEVDETGSGVVKLRFFFTSATERRGSIATRLINVSTDDAYQILV
jgi:hypothetical protein